MHDRLPACQQYDFDLADGYSLGLSMDEKGCALLEMTYVSGQASRPAALFVLPMTKRRILLLNHKGLKRLVSCDSGTRQTVFTKSIECLVRHGVWRIDSGPGNVAISVCGYFSGMAIRPQWKHRLWIRPDGIQPPPARAAWTL